MEIKKYIYLDDLVNSINKLNSNELIESLNELDKKIEEIFKKDKADITDLIVNTLSKKIDDLNEKGPYFYIWFAFLKAIFLFGGDVESNKKFRFFINYIKDRNNYYFDSFPENNFLPLYWEENKKWRYAPTVERIIKEIKIGRNITVKIKPEKKEILEKETPFGQCSSGYKFVEKVKEVAERESDLLLLYLELVGMFKSLKGIDSKIANAIIGEIGWEVHLLFNNNKKEVAEKLLKSNWLKKLILISFFNVMIDYHVKKFFQEKMNLKNVDQFTLFLLAKKVRRELIEDIFKHRFSWLSEDDRNKLLDDYFEFVAVYLIEKIIWISCFVKNKLKDEELSQLKFFKLTNDLFL